MNCCSQCRAWQFLSVTFLNHFPPALQRGRKMHHLPMSLAYLPSISWQALKQISFKLMQLRSSSCLPWSPDSLQESCVTASPGDSLLMVYPSLWQPREIQNQLVTAFSCAMRSNRQRGFPIPTYPPLGAGEEGCREETANQQPVAHPGSLRAPAQAGASMTVPSSSPPC